MANNLQNRIYLIHKVEAQKPTSNDKPTKADGNKEKTKAKAPDNGTNNGEENLEESGTIKLLSTASAKRRLANLGFSAVSNTTNTILQGKAFKASFLGDSRKAEKYTKHAQNVSNFVQFTNRTLSTAITAVALKNKALYGIYALSLASDLLSSVVNQAQQISQYNQERDRQIFESKFTQERLVKNVYNRRG